MTNIAFLTCITTYFEIHLVIQRILPSKREKKIMVSQGHVESHACKHTYYECLKTQRRPFLKGKLKQHTYR